MNHDGSMSADEYLRKAAELNERQESLHREQVILSAHKQQSDAEAVINAELLATEVRRVLSPTMRLAETVFIDFGNAKSPEVYRVRYIDADIVVRGVHNLPTRVSPGHPSFLGHHSATEPMRQQMNSGKYPTVADHIARNSIAYEPFIDEMGRFVAKQLTQAEEDAIRTRSSRNSVR